MVNMVYIKSLLSRVRVKSELPEYFIIENKLVSDKSTISNKFNQFYRNIGPNLAKEINIASSKSFRNYLKSSNKKYFDFVDVTEEIVYKIINNLKPEDSCLSWWSFVLSTNTTKTHFNKTAYNNNKSIIEIRNIPW